LVPRNVHQCFHRVAMHNRSHVHGSKEGPYIMCEITHPKTPKDGDRARVLGYTKKETYANTGLENMKLIDAEAEAVHMILNGIENDAYSTVNACQNAKKMWIAIERF
nr:hypothetical protein [Tanacetum cinerariifolium]